VSTGTDNEPTDVAAAGSDEARGTRMAAGLGSDPNDRSVLEPTFDGDALSRPCWCVKQLRDARGGC
jgi:hypothetical protein